MEKNLYIDASTNETRVVLKSGENIEDYEYEGLKQFNKNNIYLGISRIEPSLQAAFIDLEERDTDFFHSMISSQIITKFLKRI